ncbi:MAG TPA: glycosyltransferase family 39 protein [Gemmatimonadales bacterium]|nr:glycosyltransferase family 39 protein [Gemmatimonadales bacterium]
MSDTHVPVPAPGGAGSSRATWAAGAAVLVVACLAFAQTVGYAFTYDDVAIVQQRELFQDISRWREILGATWWQGALYRPFTALSVAANWSMGGGDPRIFHLTNILAHALVSVLVFFLGRALLGGWAGFAAALLFAVHPVHVEAVANVVGRAEVFAALFTVAAVLLYRADGALAEAGDRSSWRRYGATIGVMICTGLALASKESAFALPGLLLLVDWLDGQRSGRSLDAGVRRHWLLWVAVLVIAIAWLILRASVVGELSGPEQAPGMENLGLVGRAVAMLPIVPHYLRLLFWPRHLAADYSPNFVVPATTVFQREALIGLGALVFPTALALATSRRAPFLTFGLAWMAGTILIVANVLVPTGIILAERTLYLPSVGAALLGGWCLALLVQRHRLAAWAVLGTLTGLAMLRTVTRNPIWRDNASFFEAMVRDTPGSYRAAWTAAYLAFEAGDHTKSERLLREALVIDPLVSGVWRDLARSMRAQKRYGTAGTYAWTAWRVDRANIVDLRQSIEDAVAAGMVDTANARLSEGRRVVGDQAELLLAEAAIARGQGKLLKAMTLHRAAAWRRPDSFRLWWLTAGAAVEAHHCIELEHSLGRLRRLKPTYPGLAGLADASRRLGCTSLGARDSVALRRDSTSLLLLRQP